MRIALMYLCGEQVNRKRLDPSAGVGALRQEATTLEVTIQPGFKAGTKVGALWTLF